MTYQNVRPGNMPRCGMNGGARQTNVSRPAGYGAPVRDPAYEAAKRAEAERRRVAAERAAARREAEEERRRIYVARQKAYVKELERRQKAAAAAERKAEKAKLRKEERKAEAALRHREIKVAKQKISSSFVLTVLIVFVMLMAVIFSFSELSSSTTELSKLKDEIKTVEDEASKLSLQLEQKNDVNMIEQLATEKYMMVREDSVRRKYITTPTSDRIVIDAEELPTESSGGLLSSFSNLFDDVLDYFR
ncbi:MAG: hypothetical protein MJ096_01785 [Clostridia bacterium]|nr:hypothetical protein [Clostridia bacterium]